MSELQIAWLELGIVGGLGAIFVFVGIIMVVVISRKNKLCTRQTNGVVTGHRFPGQGKMYPIIEYIAVSYTHLDVYKRQGLTPTRT